MRRLLAITALVAAGLLARPAAAQNLLSNGSFENPALASGTQFTNIIAGSSIGAWTVGAGGVDLIRTYWAPFSGFQSLDLNGGAAGSISQTVATTAGRHYTLTFALAGNPDNASNKVLNVLFGSQNVGNVTFVYNASQSYSNMGWTLITFTDLVATGSSTTLTLSGVSGGAWGAALDDIVLTQNVLPEPSSAALMVTGLLGTLVMMRRRRA
jgi:choice-of-anchor C domain-containing protein